MRPRAWLALFALAAGTAALAQGLGDEKRSLNTAQAEQAAALKRAERYEADAARARTSADKARASAAAMAARIQQSEAEIASVARRIAMLARLRDEQRRRLSARQEPVARLTGALQSLARRPPVLMVVGPGTVDDLIHTRMMLTAALPVIDERTRELRGEIEEGRRLRLAHDTAIQRLRQEQAVLGKRRIELARLEKAERVHVSLLLETARLEQERALAMAERAHDLRDLVRQMDEQAAIVARLATLPVPLPRPARPDSARSAVAEAPPRPRGAPPYQLPVIGRVVEGTGEITSEGRRSRGLTFNVAPRAQVVAPAGGRVRYAEPFRNYGQIVIIDHGRGWTSLVTGLAVLTAEVGDRLVKGSPLGQAGNLGGRVTVELRHNGQTVDIASLAVDA